MSDPWVQVYARSSDVVARQIADETILVPVRRHVRDLERLFVLDEMGAAIYALFDGKTPLAGLRDRLLEEYDVERERLEPELLTFTEQLLSVGGIVPATGPAPEPPTRPA